MKKWNCELYPLLELVRWHDDECGFARIEGNAKCISSKNWCANIKNELELEGNVNIAIRSDSRLPPNPTHS